jgi:hypothetical protein
MSEESLRRFLRQINESAELRASVAQNPSGAFAAFGLSQTEQAAVATGDEDALRRLLDADVKGYIRDPRRTRDGQCVSTCVPCPTRE